MIKTLNLFRGCWAPILAYIEQQFDAYLEGETRVQRVEVIAIIIINLIFVIIIIVTINIINTILRFRIPWFMLAFTS